MLIILFLLFFFWRIKISPPKISSSLNPQSFTRKQIGPDSYTVNNCWPKKNEFGIWEMYIEGEEYERGLIYGVLAKEIIERQEEAFVKQVDEIVPNKVYRTALKGLIAWFNKDICKYIPEENQKEIYGISLSFSDKFDFVGPKYQRSLNYHAAHDIGHALNDYSMVGCTSFAVTKENSADGTLLLGRNFDFYMGDEFAKEKVLVFVNPKTGYKFSSYSWAGFTGVVSGMNEKGLTVTINASKSDIPFASKAPISLLAREILQYAKNIEEAIKIANKGKTFVSESLLIGSAEDDQAVIIEKSPKKTDVYRVTDNKLVCSNHFQSKLFENDTINLKNIETTDSKYRFNRVTELLNEKIPLNPEKAAEILRNKEGCSGKNIGLGNQKSLNQLIAHHSILFKPKNLQMWISTSPYQLGTYVCYDLNEVFKKEGVYKIDSLNIKEDVFSKSQEFTDYEKSKIIKQGLKKFALFNIAYTIDKKSEESFIKANPLCYTTYMDLGDYYKKKGDYAKAKNYYKQSLDYDVASLQDIEALNKRIAECTKKTGK
ncbi:MAG: peptidase C45 [Bacteroidia bacterium]|nr:peptidase C45 [Bacteroidia bacterium]